MHERENFQFERSKGVVWVCDLARSSSYLNNNQLVNDLETFLPRLYWISSGLVEASGGRLIKWTGDGFIAWYETPLHRMLGEQSASAFRAAWNLTFLVNVTQLGLNPTQKFKIRHGIAYEQDALLTHISHPGNYKSLEIIGRSVVLACRFSDIESPFPGIITQGELVKAAQEYGYCESGFRKLQITSGDKLRYFKNEKWGTNSIYVSAEHNQKTKSRPALLRHIAKVIKETENVGASSQPFSGQIFAERFLEFMKNGPEWCTDIVNDEAQFIKEQLLGSLKRSYELLVQSGSPAENAEGGEYL